MIPAFHHGGLGRGGAIAAGPVSDPFFANVKSLIHFDGADASTTFTDVTGRTWTAAGSAQIDTAQSKYGGASGLFDGNGDWILTADSSDFDFDGTPAKLFTIEGWFRSATTAQIQVLASRGGGAASWNAANSYEWLVYVSNTDGKLRFAWNFNGSASPQALASSANIVTSAFVHWAVTFDGTTMRLLAGGAVEASTTSNVNMIKPASANLIRVGGPVDGTATQSINGHLDDFRLTTGVARYTGAYSPPSVFPDL